MLYRIFSKPIGAWNELFNGHYLDVKVLYTRKFNEIPCIVFVGDLDPGRTFDYILDHCRPAIRAVYQHSFFDHTEQKVFYNNNIYVLKDKRMIELTNDYCQLLHTPEQYGWAHDLALGLAPFRVVKEPVTRVIGFAGHHDMN